MESHPPNPEFRNNPENFHSCSPQDFGAYYICFCMFVLILFIPVNKDWSSWVEPVLSSLLMNTAQ